MQRVLEPELMDDPEQALAYARADFNEINQLFVQQFLEAHADFQSGHVLDLGCGPADIPIRLLRALPGCRVTAVDASQAMIRLAQEAVGAAGLGEKISLRCERFQTLSLDEPADAVVSNSLVHHVPNPLQFWYRVKQLTRPGGTVLVMDLLRPESHEAARALVDQYAANEPAILQRDFYLSLLAALTEDEVAAHLAELNLSRLFVDVVDDRHWVVMGRVY
jgi:2-polyprenyl-3-methyl-5-hydroxy-6-metoxy-1,4-benzoquinol methylase